MVRVATIGGGPIVRTFVAALGEVPGIELAGAYSRDPERAAALASEFGAATGWSSMDDLLADDAVDAVYVASPNSVHYGQALAVVEAGKHVLLEKPAVTSAAEFTTLLEAAAQRGVIVFEGMRNAYDPGTAKVRELLGELGPIRRVSFVYCQRSARYDQVLAGEQVNIFDPELAGGALFDLGVYCVSALVDLFGPPDRVLGLTVPIRSGVDGAGVALAAYPGFVADLSYSKITVSGRPSEIQGEAATMTIDHITAPRRLEVRTPAGEIRQYVIDPPTAGLPVDNLRFELLRFLDLVAGRATPEPDQARTLETIRVIDALRAAD
ncbi:MAG: Gfo/Idh/MocA family oxidoreductase [Actinobacteria bacterium]|nr:Gfo/Idh/MocA family oxidoreductase [Actinomycetota bacterium]